MRTTTLTAAALLGLTLLAPTQAATATTEQAAETCQGVPATIVGTPEGRVVGTAGDDVIVSGGAWSVKAGDGDDLVCIPPMEGELLGNVVDVDAGAGDDTVVSEGDRNNSDVTLGPGVDTFRGGGWEDRIEAGFEDTVVADRGDDFVNYSIEPGESLPDTVGTTVSTRRSGWIKVTAPGRRIAIDGKAGEIRVDGQVVNTFGISPRMLFGVAQRVELVGSSGVDRLAVGPCGLGVVTGRGGDDDILHIRDDALRKEKCDPRMRVDGGGGKDTIRGTVNADVLRGGGGNDWIKGRKGKDLAVGGSGRDTCFAERTRSCER
jgi:Ca2+-binding RTX toxin-like protein